MLLLAIFFLWSYSAKAPKIILPVDIADTIQSWNFADAYTTNSELAEKASVEVNRLKDLVGKSKDIPDYQIYIQIAAQYELLGNGEKTYEYLNRAVAIDQFKTGLAWMNLGGLMEKLGAFNTARVAYAKAVEAQPDVIAYHIARLSFLTRHFSKDTIAVEGAFSEALAQFGDTPQILQIKAQWFASVGKYIEAIIAWKQVRSIVGELAPSIDKEIQRLQTKL